MNKAEAMRAIVDAGFESSRHSAEYAMTIIERMARKGQTMAVMALVDGAPEALRCHGFRVKQSTAIPREWVIEW